MSRNHHTITKIVLYSLRTTCSLYMYLYKEGYILCLHTIYINVWMHNHIKMLSYFALHQTWTSISFKAHGFKYSESCWLLHIANILAILWRFQLFLGKLLTIKIAGNWSQEINANFLAFYCLLHLRVKC